MNYRDIDELFKEDRVGKVARGLIQIYEARRQENLLKWIKEYPKYWADICNMNNEEITPDYAEKVMKTLIDSNIVELQMIWFLKCGDKVDIFGNKITEEKNMRVSS